MRYQVRRGEPPYQDRFYLWQWRRSRHGGSFRRQILYRSGSGVIRTVWPFVTEIDLGDSMEVAIR